MGGWSALIEILKRPTVGDAWMELVSFLGLLWIAVLFGIFTGWAWKPKWACVTREKFDGGKMSDMASLPSSIALGLMSSFSSFVPWISEGKEKNQTCERTETVKCDSGYVHFWVFFSFSFFSLNFIGLKISCFVSSFCFKFKPCEF